MLFKTVNLKNGTQSWDSLTATFEQADNVGDDTTPSAEQLVLDVANVEWLTLFLLLVSGAGVTAIHFQIKGCNDDDESDPDAFFENTVPAESSGDVTWNDEEHGIPVLAVHTYRKNIKIDPQGMRRIVILAKDVGGTGSVVNLEAVGSITTEV